MKLLKRNFSSIASTGSLNGAQRSFLPGLIMRIRVKLTSVVVPLAPLQMMAEEGRGQSMRLFSLPGLCGKYFISAYSSPISLA